jgi:hypothetical protein
MPWIALVCACLVGACSFDADYSGGMYTCHDGKCPSGLKCSDDKVCIAGDDAGVDAWGDAMTDARQAALTCADPGLLATTGGSDTNTTSGKSPKVSPQCNGTVMTGADAVYKIEPGSGKQMLVDIATTDSGFSVTAYVTTTCPSSACLTNAYATPGNPISITTLAGPHYIVVDSGISAASGPYMLMVTTN